MYGVAVTVGWWAWVRRGGSGLLVAPLMAMLTLAVAPASARSAPSVDVRSLAGKLEREPAQVTGAPSFSLSAAGVRALRGEIRRVDPGRIWVAVVPSLSEKATSDLSNALSGYLNADGGGTVIVVAGSHVWGSTSWEDGAAATGRLQQAFKGPRDPLALQLRRAVDSFASGDDAAGHPQLNGGDAGSAGRPPATATQPSGGGQRTGGSSGGSIVGLVVLALALLGTALIGGKRVRAALRASHRRKEERADLREGTQRDFGKLGEAIEGLDIDSSMPAASARGKDEYAQAIECYQDAERRLHDPDDEYQFERAVAAIERGLEHVHAADQLFNASDEPASR
jgi:hypothetical protein